jgi:hypothetical protein
MVLQAAVMTQLAPLGRVFDAVPARAATPYLVVDAPVLAAGDAVGVAGRAGTLAVSCIDGGVSPVRVRALLAAVEAALGGLPAQVGEGWRVTSIRLARSQMAIGKGERWSATSVFAVRMYRSN